jgi:putative membrane protein
MFLRQCWHLKKAWTQPTDRVHGYKIYWKYSPFVLTLILAFLLPNTSLSASLVQNKGLNSQITSDVSKGEYRPLAAELKETNLIKVTDKNFIAVMSELYCYPKEYVGKEIEMQGFIFKDSSKSPDRFSLVRYVIACCVADASPYGVLCEIKDAASYPEGGWYQIQGTIEVNENQGKSFPVIKITWIKSISPLAVPYVFP